jgi:hypothetical protein
MNPLLHVELGSCSCDSCLSKHRSDTITEQRSPCTVIPDQIDVTALHDEDFAVDLSNLCLKSSVEKKQSTEYSTRQPILRDKPRRRRYRMYPKREELQRSMPDLRAQEVEDLYSRTQFHNHHKSTNDLYANLRRNNEDTMSTNSYRSSSYYDNQHNEDAMSTNTYRSSSYYDNQRQHDQPQQNVVEVSPGLFLTLRTSQETIQAYTTGTAVKIKCLLCPLQLYCVPDCEMVLCPDCRVLVPLEQRHPHSHGVGLGLKSEMVN